MEIRQGPVAPVGVDPSFWANRRVLVTGDTGFKGAWLCLWLSTMDADVTGLGLEPPTSPSLFKLAELGDLIKHVDCDIRHPDAVTRAFRASRPEIVIHMAAQSLVRRSFRAPRETYETNVMGTVNVLEAARELGTVSAIVNVTSDKCYENREWDWGYREDEAMGGFDPYSSSKGCAELLTDAWRRSFALPVASARAGNVLGGGDWAEDRLVADLMRNCIAGNATRIRNPDAVRPWQHVLNPLRGYLMLAAAVAKDAEHAAAFNFGPADEDARSVRWIAEALSARWPGGLEWTADPGPDPHEARYLKVDSSRAKARLGWAPLWGLEDALTSICEWYQALVDGANMRDVTLSQISEYVRAGDSEAAVS